MNWQRSNINTNLYCYEILTKDGAFVARLTINQLELNNYF